MYIYKNPQKNINNLLHSVSEMDIPLENEALCTFLKSINSDKKIKTNKNSRYKIVRDEKGKNFYIKEFNNSGEVNIVLEMPHGEKMQIKQGINQQNVSDLVGYSVQTYLLDYYTLQGQTNVPPEDEEMLTKMRECINGCHAILSSSKGNNSNKSAWSKKLNSTRLQKFEDISKDYISAPLLEDWIKQTSKLSIFDANTYLWALDVMKKYHDTNEKQHKLLIQEIISQRAAPEQLYGLQKALVYSESEKLVHDLYIGLAPQNQKAQASEEIKELLSKRYESKKTDAMQNTIRSLGDLAVTREEVTKAATIIEGGKPNNTEEKFKN